MLSRAAKKKGTNDCNIGGLVFELSEQKLDENKTANWIEIVINNLHMQDLISDEVLNGINDKIEQIKSRTQRQHNVFKELQTEVKTINFDMLFKDPVLLKNIRKIMTDRMKKKGDQKAVSDMRPSNLGDNDKSMLKMDKTIATGMDSGKSSSS